MRTNNLGQPIGAALADWQPASFPPRTTLVGRTCQVEPLVVERHAAALFAANQHDETGRNWTYLLAGPFDQFAAYRAWLEQMVAQPDTLLHAIIDARSQQAVGVAAYMRIAPEHGSIEVGNINFSPLLQRTPVATEAMYRMMAQVFALGYRRYEWKCDALNAASRAAAQRFGFSYEGTFRQAVVYKGRNRDTAWFSILDGEWPALRAALETWLDPANFDDAGQQRLRLADLTAPLLAQRDV